METIIIRRTYVRRMRRVSAMRAAIQNFASGSKALCGINCGITPVLPAGSGAIFRRETVRGNRVDEHLQLHIRPTLRANPQSNLHLSGTYALVVGLPLWLLWMSYRREFFRFVSTEDEILVMGKAVNNQRSFQALWVMAIGLLILMGLFLFLFGPNNLVLAAGALVGRASRRRI